jgi:hypothetical protein
VRVIAGVVAVGLEAEDRVVAGEDEFFKVAHGVCSLLPGSS